MLNSVFENEIAALNAVSQIYPALLEFAKSPREHPCDFDLQTAVTRRCTERPTAFCSLDGNNRVFEYQDDNLRLKWKRTPEGAVEVEIL